MRQTTASLTGGGNDCGKRTNGRRTVSGSSRTMWLGSIQRGLAALSCSCVSTSESLKLAGFRYTHTWLCGSNVLLRTLLACVSRCLVQHLQWSRSSLLGLDDEAGCISHSARGDNTSTPISVFDVSVAGADDAAWTPNSMCEMPQS